MRTRRTLDGEGFDGVVRAGLAAPGRAFDADGFDGIARWVAPAPAGRALDAEGLDGVVLGDWVRAVPVLVEVWATEPVALPPDALPTRLIARAEETPRERAARIGLTVVRSDGAPTERLPAAGAPDPTDAPDLPLLDLAALELRPPTLHDPAPEDVLPIGLVDHVPTEVVEAILPVAEVEHLPTELFAAVGPAPLPDPEPPSTTIDVRWDGWGSPGAVGVVEVEPTEVITPVPAPAREPEPELEPEPEPEPAAEMPAPTLVPVERAERPAPPPLEPLARSPQPPARRTPAVPETPLPLAARPTRPLRGLPVTPPPAPTPAPTPAPVRAAPLPLPVPRAEPPARLLSPAWSLAAAALLLAASVVFAASVAGAGLAFALTRAPARDLVPIGRAAETIEPSNP